MNRKLAASLLSALLYAQGLLGVAGLATVLIKHQAGQSVAAVQAPAPAV